MTRNDCRAINTQELSSVIPVKIFEASLHLTENELLYSRLAEPLEKIRDACCGNGPLREKDAMVQLTREREDNILREIGFYPDEIEHDTIESLRASYDLPTFKTLKQYLGEIKKNYNGGLNVSFFGGNGSGKTSSMQLVFRYLLREFYNPFTQKVNLGMVKKPVDEIIEMVLEDKFNTKAWYYDVRVLGLDDMRHYTETRHNALRTFLNYRFAMGSGYLTVMTSRLLKSEMANYPDINSRLKYGLCFWTLGKDFRDIKIGNVR